MAAVLLLGCGSPPSPSSPPRSDGWGDAPRVAHDAALPQRPTPSFDLRSRLPELQQVAELAQTKHPGKVGSARILVSASLRHYPALGPLRPVEPGAVVVEAFLPAAGASGVLYGMSRTETNTWAFSVTTDAGVPLPENLAACERCHADAPNDGLYAPPR